MPKNVLIICWDFFTPGAIGGRRWSKIAKSMVRKGLNVSILATPASAKADSWIGEEYIQKMRIYEIRSNFLSRWLTDYGARWKSVKIRVAQIFLRLFHRGTIFDKAILIERKFISKASEIVRNEKIEVVFVTGAPFSLMYYAAKLKVVFPNLKVVADYRDPWTGAVNYGMKDLRLKDKNAEEEKQNFVFENSDVVSAPNEFLLKEIAESYSGRSVVKARFYELQHAYDPDDVVNPQVGKRDFKRIIYAGSVYMHSEPYLRQLIDAIHYYNQEPGINELRVDIYTGDRVNLKDSERDVMRWYKPIGNDIFQEIVNCDLVIILLSDHNKNYVTSKFYEFLPYNKPFLYIGPEGFVSRKIEEEKLGIVLRNPADLVRFFSSDFGEKYSSRDLSKYTFDRLTQKLLDDLE